jgi:hypothetical protein
MKTPVSSPQLGDRRGQRPAGDPDGGTDRRDLFVRLDAARRSERWTAIDDLRIGEGQRQQLREQRRHGVGADAARVDVRRDALEHLDEVHRVPGDPVEVIVRDLVRNAFVPGAEEVDLARPAHGHAAGTERARARVPEERHTGHVPDVGDPSEHEHVEVVLLHGGEGPLAPALPEGGMVRERLSRHTVGRGSR